MIHTIRLWYSRQGAWSDRCFPDTAGTWEMRLAAWVFGMGPRGVLGRGREAWDVTLGKPHLPFGQVSLNQQKDDPRCPLRFYHIPPLASIFSPFLPSPNNPHLISPQPPFALSVLDYGSLLISCFGFPTVVLQLSLGLARRGTCCSIPTPPNAHVHYVSKTKKKTQSSFMLGYW